MSYVIGFLNQIGVLGFFSEIEIWELSDEFWVLVMSLETELGKLSDGETKWVLNLFCSPTFLFISYFLISHFCTPQTKWTLK